MKCTLGVVAILLALNLHADSTCASRTCSPVPRPEKAPVVVVEATRCFIRPPVPQKPLPSLDVCVGDYGEYFRRSPKAPVVTTELKNLQHLGFKGLCGVDDKTLQNYTKPFKNLDKANTGFVTQEDYVKKGRHMTEAARKGIFTASDCDKDGKMSLAEYVLNRAITDDAKALVNPADANKDGKITQAEFATYFSTKDKTIVETVFVGLDSDKNGSITVPEYLKVWGIWARPDIPALLAKTTKRLEKLAPQTVTKTSCTKCEQGKCTCKNRPKGRPTTPATR